MNNYSHLKIISNNKRSNTRIETNKNYGFVVEVNGNIFGTYGPTSSHFVGLSSLNSDSSLSIGFEDTVNGDNDFNALIFTVSNLIA